MLNIKIPCGKNGRDHGSIFGLSTMYMGNNRNLPIFSNVKKMSSLHLPIAKIAHKQSP
jgi:hypothetical protein